MTNYTKIVDLMNKAHEKVQYPKFVLKNGYTLKRIGAQSRRYDGGVNITDGKTYGSCKWYGRIDRNGVLFMPNNMQGEDENLQIELDLFMLDPVKYAKGFATLEGSCMYCMKKLTHPQSVSVGYGATCAANYGLPWGDLSEKDAQKNSQLEFDIAIRDIHQCPNDNGKQCLQNCEVEECKKESLKALAELPPSTFNDSPKCHSAIIGSLKQVLLWNVSGDTYNYIIDILDAADSSHETQYNVLVTALWENL